MCPCGRPMPVVPSASDQPDDAARRLRALLGDPGHARRAAEVGDRIRREDGVLAAADALEALLRVVPRRGAAAR